MRTNFKMEHEYLILTRGDTLSFGLKLLDENGDPFLQEPDSIFFSCKSSQFDDSYIFIKSLGKGITKVGTGEYSIRVAPEDTIDLEARKYFYDLEIRLNGDVFTLKKGVFEIEHDITRNPSETTKPTFDYREITYEEIDAMFEVKL